MQAPRPEDALRIQRHLDALVQSRARRRRRMICAAWPPRNSVACPPAAARRLEALVGGRIAGEPAQTAVPLDDLRRRAAASGGVVGLTESATACAAKAASVCSRTLLQKRRASIHAAHRPPSFARGSDGPGGCRTSRTCSSPSIWHVARDGQRLRRPSVHRLDRFRLRHLEAQRRALLRAAARP